MPEIWISSTHEIIGTLRTEPNDGPFIFHCADDNLAECEVVIDAAGETITSKARAEISDDLLKALENKTRMIDLPQVLGDELVQMEGHLTTVSRRVLRLLQQELEDPTLLPTNELANSKFGWSQDGEIWLPMAVRYSAAIYSHSVGQLNERSRQIVQKRLTDGEEPLLAMQHLYETHKSDGLRFKWIEATIAAELAIKEMLIRMEPKLETLLIEVPSPPLHILYGKVLESVAGEKSPYVSQLQNGAKQRNELVHRPETEDLNHQEVFDYVAMVGEAIRHLLELHRRRRKEI